MRLSSALRGQHFGQLAYMRGIITYRLSPFEQKAFAGLGDSIPNIFVRLRSNIFKMAPPFIIAYLVFTETEKEFHQMCRKNPADYKNDK